MKIMREWTKKQINVPNTITLIRLLFIPWLSIEIYNSKGYSRLTFILYVLIWATDFLDGWIARKTGAVTDLGKLLDPLVDKLLHIVTAIMLTIVGRIPIWFPIAFVVKEILMVLGAVVLVNNKMVMSSRWYGKVSTVVVAAVFALVLIIPERYIWINSYLFFIAMLSIYASLIGYGFQLIYLLASGRISEIEFNEEGTRDLSSVSFFDDTAKARRAAKREGRSSVDSTDHISK